MDEVELKRDIIAKLESHAEILSKYDKTLSEDFIRGFTAGAETFTKIRLPAHWYTQIVNKLQTGSELRINDEKRMYV